MFIRTIFGYNLKDDSRIKIFDFGYSYYVQRGRYGKLFRSLDSAKDFAVTLLSKSQEDLQ